MKRTILFGVLAALLAIGGCPAQKPDPQPGVVTVLTAGSYSGTLDCTTVDATGATVRTSTSPGKVLVTDAGGLRLFDSNIAPDATLTDKGTGYTVQEHVDSITQDGQTLTLKTTGTLTANGTVVQTSRTATVEQMDPQTILLTNATTMTDATGKTFTTTCGGDVTQ